MCLGIVGHIVTLDENCGDLANVDVAGLVRKINIAILEGENPKPGDYVLIHAGFAIEKISEETARRQVEALRDYTGQPENDDT